MCAELALSAGMRNARWQPVTRVPGHVEQRVDLGHAHALGACGDPHDLVAGLHLALLQHAEVETGPAVCDEQCRHPRLVHADAHAETSHARLGDFEQGAAHAVAVADANFLVGQAVDGEVLSELSVGEVVSVELALPVTVGVRPIDEDGAVLTPVSGQIPLAVAVMLSRRTMRGPGTDAFHTAVWTVFSRHATSRGRPTFTETNRGIIHLPHPTTTARCALRTARRPPASGAREHEEPWDARWRRPTAGPVAGWARGVKPNAQT